MSKSEIQVFYGTYGGIVSGVYGNEESCIASRGKYHAFTNYYEACLFACTGIIPEKVKENISKKEQLSETEKKVHFSTENINENEKKVDTKMMEDDRHQKEEVVFALRKIADSLEKEHIDKIKQEINVLSDKFNHWKVESTSGGDRMSRLHMISAEMEELISMMRKRLNLVTKK